MLPRTPTPLSSRNCLQKVAGLVFPEAPDPEAEDNLVKESRHVLVLLMWVV